MQWPFYLAITLVILKWASEAWLEALNRKHALAHAGAVPGPFRDQIDPDAYARSVEYTLAKSRFGQWHDLAQVLLLLGILIFGLLPWSFAHFIAQAGTSVWALGSYLFLVALVMTLPSLPFEWHQQFRLEARFGFNTATQRTWWLDRLKATLLAVVLGYPLLVLILKLVEWTGAWWWLWAWICLTCFQLVMLILAPVVILPLFNKFTPLPEGDLRLRLLNLARRTDFHTQGIQVMDGSRRSRHSNAFFTGFGRFRRIVLFDTLIQELTAPELEAVLAHEIGHYRKRHIFKLLVWSTLSSGFLFYCLGWLARQPLFYQAFGFPADQVAAVILLFGLLSGTVTFWLEPLTNLWLRRHEYQADRFAAETMGETNSLKNALRKLSEKNLSNLTPHPLYSGFYYSHPTLLERERALATLTPA